MLEVYLYLLFQAYCKQNLEMNVSTENVLQVLETAHGIGISLFMFA